MSSNKLFSTIRESLGNVHREFKVTFSKQAQPEKWLFLAGCYNSGTTLLAELLSEHTSISALPDEGHFLTDQLVKDYNVGLPRMWCLHEALFRLTETSQGPDVERIKKEWAIRLDHSKPVFLEKSPPNTPRMRWLQKHFQPAYFVVIIRNGYAVAEGITRKGDPQHLEEGWPIELSARQWRRSYEMILEDEKFLERVLWVTYEDLVADPQKTLNSICEFVGIPGLEDFDKNRSFAIHEKQEGIRDMNASSIARLSKEDISKINDVAEDYLERFSYAVIND